MAAVATDVVERADLAFVASHNDDALIEHRGGEVIADSCDVGHMTDEDPTPKEDLFTFAVEHGRIRVELRRQGLRQR